MRPRRRYLVVRWMTEDGPPSESVFREALWQHLQQLYGELGVSRIGFWVILYDAKLCASIIRCQHDQVRVLRAALASITHIGGTPILLHIVGVSGTIRKAKTLVPGLELHKSPRRR